MLHVPYKKCATAQLQCAIVCHLIKFWQGQMYVAQFLTATWNLDKMPTQDILKFWQVTWEPPGRVSGKTEFLISGHQNLNFGHIGGQWVTISSPGFLTTTGTLPFPARRVCGLHWRDQHCERSENFSWPGSLCPGKWRCQFALVQNHISKPVQTATRWTAVVQEHPQLDPSPSKPSKIARGLISFRCLEGVFTKPL